MNFIQAPSALLFGAGDSDNYNILNENEETGVISKNRKRTDLPILVVHGLFLLVLIGVVSYCVFFGDIERLTVGYDRCGNVCGKINRINYDFETNCKSEDMTTKPYLNVQNKACVESCGSQYIVIGKRCVPSGGINPDPGEYIHQIGRDLHHCSSELVGLSFLSLGFAFVIFLILRYMTAAFVWTTLIGVVLSCVALSGFFWYLTESASHLIPLAAFFTIITLIILLVILFARKKIELVIQLLKEAGKAVSAIPIVVLQPILTFIALGLVVSLFVYLVLWIESAGVPQESGDFSIRFHKNGVIQFTRWFNVFVMLWMIQFIYGCQNMMLSGAVSVWYFTRNKAYLRKPLWNSARNMFLYHLGTISAGSLIITLIQMLRILLRVFRRYIRYPLYLCFLCCLLNKIDTCLNYLEDIVKYLTRNAYIVTAIYGTPFFESGTKAFKLLCENILNVMAINSVGDFVLALAKILVVLLTIGVGVALLQNKTDVNNIWAVYLVAVVVSFLVAHCFITVYEMAVDTIFICFCEDCNINDGMARPYYMSHSLMEFVEKSKVVLNIKEREGGLNTAVLSAE